MIEEYQKDGWRLHTYQAQGSPTMVNHYLLFEREEGKKMPSIVCMIYFRETYNLDLNWLLTGAPTLVEQEKFMDGLPPILVKKYFKENKIPVKEEYEELIELLQVPGVYHLINAKLTEAKNVFRDEIKAQIRSGKLKQLSG